MELLLSSSRLNFHMDVHECVPQDQHCNYIKMLLTALQIFFLDTNICKLSWLTYPWSFWGVSGASTSYQHKTKSHPG